MAKDTRERAMDPNFDIRAYLEGTYLHPAFRREEDDDDEESGGNVWTQDPPLVATKRMSRGNTPVASVTSEVPIVLHKYKKENLYLILTKSSLGFTQASNHLNHASLILHF